MSITFYIVTGLIILAVFLVLALLAISPAIVRPAIVAPDEADDITDDPRPAQVLREGQKGVRHG